MSNLKYIKKAGTLAAALILFSGFAMGQTKVLDKVTAVIGNSPILLSDIETQYARYQLEGGTPNPDIKCQILQTIISQKLLGQQAIIDSITVSDEELDNEVDRRMRISIQRAGGQDRLEQFLGRSVLQYKDEIRPDLREQMVAQRMRSKIIEKLNVTPQEVKEYFDKIPKDSLPTFNKEVEVGEIVFKPQLTKEEKAATKQKAEELRERVKKGEDFAALARLYSQDKMSAVEGGDLGFADRQTFVKEFAAYAFKLKAGEISPVFETDYGFHFLQVIERRGEQVHVRHILLMPTVTQASLDRAQHKADSIYNMLQKDKKIDFSSAASYYSDNKETKYNGGLMLNLEDVQSRSTLIPTDKLDPQVALTVDTMKVGQIAKPALFTERDGTKDYKILFLKTVTDAHKASLEKDFPKIKERAYAAKMDRVISEWFERKRKQTYIRIDKNAECGLLKGWSTDTTAQAN